MECRVFKLDVGWGYALFHFPMEIEGIMVRKNTRTSPIKKDNYIGTFTFDEEYLKSMESDVMNDIKYYFVYFMTVNE